MQNISWAGIDYGSKLAGTTVICFLKGDKLHFLQSEKKRDADAFIVDFVNEHQPQNIFIDAPLSLPAAYFGNGNNYFYRECDRETKAMSPMFLGGLTARAMRLNSDLRQVKYFETYPAYLAKDVLGLKDFYNKKSKDSSEFINKLLSSFSITLESLPTNWHQVDALLCWLSGWRFHNKTILKIGNIDEGIIYI